MHFFIVCVRQFVCQSCPVQQRSEATQPVSAQKPLMAVQSDAAGNGLKATSGNAKPPVTGKVCACVRASRPKGQRGASAECADLKPLTAK